MQNNNEESIDSLQNSDIASEIIDREIFEQSIEMYIENGKKRRMRNNLSMHKAAVAAAEWRQKRHGRADLSVDIRK